MPSDAGKPSAPGREADGEGSASGEDPATGDPAADGTAVPSGSLTTVGRVVKPHGIRGEVVVERLSDIPGRLAPGTTVRLGEVDRTITGSRPHKGRLLVALEGVADRTAAEELRGLEVRAEPIDEEATETYLAHELIGLEVRRATGERLGSVVELHLLPAAAGYELLEVEREDGSTFLLPGVDELVEAVDEGGGGLHLVVTDPPEGLVD